MSAGGSGSQSRVVRFDVVRFRLGSTLVPLAFVAVGFGHLRGQPLLYVVGAVLSLGAFAAFVSGRRAFRVQGLRRRGHLLVFDGREETIDREDVTLWTWENGVARVYVPSAAWKLLSDDGEELRSTLTVLFGAPQVTRPRGSRAGRLTALVVGLTGVVATLSAFVFDAPRLAAIGVPFAILGLATLGALSRPVVSRTS